jgi:2-haloacid dehalogenase
MSALPLIVFDVNEMLLDLGQWSRCSSESSETRRYAALVRRPRHVFAGPEGGTAYLRFTEIGAAVLTMRADAEGIRIERTDGEEINESFSTMPPYPEMPEALRKLHDAGFGCSPRQTTWLKFRPANSNAVKLQNSSKGPSAWTALRSIRPRRKYAHVKSELEAPSVAACMIACHVWDKLSAAASWEAAFIRRLRNDVLGVGPQPQIIGNDLADVAEQFITGHTTRR